MTPKISTRQLDEILTESKVSGGTGLDAEKLTVKLWGKGVFRSSAKRSGSAQTVYYRRQSGQLIFSKLDFLNGAIGVIPDELDGFQSTSDLPAFVVDGVCDPYYVFNFLRRESFYKSFKGAARGGRKAKRVALKQLALVRLPIASLEDQEKSVSLYKYNLASIEAAELLKKKYLHLLIHFRNNFYSQKVNRFEEFGAIVAEVKEPVVPSNGVVYREIGVRSHGKGIFVKGNVSASDIGKKRVFKVSERCLIFNVVFAWEGAIAVTESQHLGFISSHRFPQYKIASKTGLTLDYLRHYFLSECGLTALQKVSPGGAGRNKTLNKGKLLRLKIPIFSDDQIACYMRLCNSIEVELEFLTLLQKKIRHIDESANEKFFLELFKRTVDEE
jgi:type I restriction enzyme, S subunit